MNSNTDPGQRCIKSSGMRSGPLAESEGRSRDLELREGVEARLLSAPVESVPPVIDKAAKVVDARAIGPRVAGRLIRKAGAREMVAQIRNLAVGAAGSANLTSRNRKDDDE